jgi:putative membrane protein
MAGNKTDHPHNHTVDHEVDHQINQMTYKEAFLKSPGPGTPREALMLAAKGLCMGTADIIPGVSGGTIALITGIYNDLLMAVKSVDTRAVRHLLALDFKKVMAHVHLRFIGSLFLGIAVAIISLARIMHYLLNHHPVETASLFSA